jgi:hypothetical protein
MMKIPIRRTLCLTESICGCRNKIPLIFKKRCQVMDELSTGSLTLCIIGKIFTASFQHRIAVCFPIIGFRENLSASAMSAVHQL